MVRSLLWPRRAAFLLRGSLAQTLSHYASANLLAVASPQTHCAFIGQLPAPQDDLSILFGVQRIAHVLLLHGAIDDHFALFGSLSVHLGRDGKD